MYILLCNQEYKFFNVLWYVYVKQCYECFTWTKALALKLKALFHVKHEQGNALTIF